MKADSTHEQRFITDVDSLKFGAQNIDPVLHALDRWRTQLEEGLRAARLTCDGLADHHPLACRANAIDVALDTGIRAWVQQWADLEGARALSDALDDTVLLLVFGKFNAGKSSFCNFLAERLALHGRAVRYFHVDAGRLVETDGRFAEGTTETTARLQGVHLGDKLVLLDTPGLHSVTPENAALTQRFTDSADAILWLTSSTSPGQVQELDELGRELHRNKPLLPVITRSDLYDEDEIDGEIRKILRNKSVENRAHQEADVTVRAREKLVAMGVDSALLKAPVSISSHMAREAHEIPAALADAGFERLYAALIDVAEPALAYKARKRAEVLLHHLEENVIGQLQRDVLPLLDELYASAQAARESLEQQRTQVADAVWRSIVPTLPALLDAHAATRDVGVICRVLSRSVFDAFTREIGRRLIDYVVVNDASLAHIEVADDAGFEEIVIGGTGISRDRHEVVGVDYQRLYMMLEMSIRETLLRLSINAVEQCDAAINVLLMCSANIKNILKNFDKRLIEIKVELRKNSNSLERC